jgi:UDP-N-acetylmuramoyl-tripeptide--D-alanyl-D-alanine ligase
MHIEKLYSIFLASKGVCTDTRKFQKDTIFFALKGSNFNGNLFAKQALDAGAIAVVVDETQNFTDERIILVNDTLKTLQQLATHHRLQLRIPFIAIAGSNGKTTTKELIQPVLSTTYNTFATQGNLNNHIGVPLTILSLKKDTEMAVIEFGANHVGETAFLCEILEPDFGIITNNGKDHLEGYGSLENVKKGNGELFAFLKAHNGTAFVNDGDTDLMRSSSGLKRITYGNTHGDVTGDIVSNNPFLKIKWNNHLINTQLFGKYNFENILCAIAVGNYFKVSEEDICKAIENYTPKNNRSQVIQFNTNTVVIDCYNANPSSMALAIESFAEWASDKKMLILGDMFELGEFSNKEHKQILNLIAQKHFSDIILVGPEFSNADSKNNYRHFASSLELKKWFDEQHFLGYSILLKGSRGMTLEKLLN